MKFFFQRYFVSEVRIETQGVNPIPAPIVVIVTVVIVLVAVVIIWGGVVREDRGKIGTDINAQSNNTKH